MAREETGTPLERAEMVAHRERAEAVAHRVGLGANLTIERPGAGWAVSPAVSGTTDWTFVTVEVDSGSATAIDAQARLGHYGSTSQGRAWFDDLRLEEIP